MKYKKKTIILIIALLLVSIVAISTYAIYKSTATGTSGFKTAAWSIKLNNQNITTSNTFTFDLKDADWTHNAVITPNDDTVQVIAPGSVGTFGIEIDTDGTEVDVEYTITAVVKNGDTVVDLSTVNPNLSIGLYRNDTLISNPITDRIKAGDKENLEIRIIWNEVDSSESNANDIGIEDTNYSVEVTVVTKQAGLLTALETITSTTGLVEVAGAKRYVGATPDNYVKFNGEEWRIIGVYGDNIKIIKSTPTKKDQVFNSYEYNNKWSGSSIQNTYLNNQYYPSLSDSAKSMIVENASWYVGSNTYNDTASEAYTNAQATTWTGKVGLIAVYEYLYAGSDQCYNVIAQSYYSANNKACYNSNWLSNVLITDEWDKDVWTINPSKSYSSHAIFFTYNGSISSGNVLAQEFVYPVVYIKSTVKVAGGNGSSSNPYKLSL